MDSKAKIRLSTHAEKPWHSFLTLDIIVAALNKTFLHWFVAWMVPLCLRAQATPFDATAMRVTVTYASLISVWWVLDIINKRIAYGPPREVDLEEEVIVITGGASGLGLTIAEIYGMRKASVAVLDLKHVVERENEGMSGVQFYECDLGNREQVEKVKGRIEKELGSPTILINCAASPISGKPLMSLSASETQQTISTNLTSQFTTLQLFLPGMLSSPTGGTVVTVSSILGYIGAGKLSAYCATKAAQIAMHKSLTAELRGNPKIKTILVTPGQMKTPLFAGVATPTTFLAPIVEPIELAKEIVNLIDSGNGGHISMPTYSKFIAWGSWAVLPAGIQHLVRVLGGIDEAVTPSSIAPREDS